MQRAVWLIYYHAQSGAFAAGDIMRVFIHGLQLDASTAGYATALPLLLSLTAIWLPDSRRTERIMRRAATLYFVAAAAVMSWIFTVDMGLFEYWQTRIDSQILVYSPREMLASLTLGQFLSGTLYFAASATLAVVIYRLIYRRLFTLRRPRRRIVATGIMLLAAIGLFAVIRGGFSPAVANVSKVYFSKEMFLNQAAVNPVFSFLSTAVGGDDYDRYRFFDDNRAEELFGQAIGGNDPIAAQESAEDAEDSSWLTTDRPHIVLIIMEGFGRTMTDASWHGEPVAPNINALRAEGIWFENLYASSFRTDRGTVATLSGFPAQPQMSIMKDVRKAAALPSLARTLGRDAGYRSRFFYGGDANFTNTRAYLFSTGFDEVVDEKNMSGDNRSKWGYADDEVMEIVAQSIIEAAEDDAPRFDVWLTLSSHEPFEVPYARRDNELLNAFAFTDEVVG
ncbi:MAG: LTA synthase family protein, partial [Alistipes sp.]|nr:LTA synthase family protein [Alistipes sp.]